MKYHNFSISIGEIGQGGAHTIKIYCPEGEFCGTFKNPYSKSELKEELIDNKLSTRSREDIRLRGGLTDIEPVKSVDELKEIGQSIYRSLFHEDVSMAFAACTGRLGDGEGIRIRIQIDPQLNEYSELMSLPWEFMYDSSKRDFITLRDNMVVVRYPEAPSRISPLNVTPPLRILAIASEPSDYDSLRLGNEILSLAEAFKKENAPIEIKLLDEPPTVDALDIEVHNQTYHIIHFMGHGDYDPDSGKSYLVFKHSDGTGHLVGGDKLRHVLTNSVKLVFLNACETARVGDSDPFAAISTELALFGVPAVLAMQFPISNVAAMVFSKKFYTLLASGYPVDQCLAFGRRAISFDQQIESEWGTPVLFMRAPDGTIFNIGSKQDPPPPPPPPEYITFPDVKLDKEIRTRINKATGDIQVTDLELLTEISIIHKFRNSGISDLSGLEFCTNLKTLKIVNANLTDISPIAHLNKLDTLNLESNQITDISPLSSLTGLTKLNLAGNKITNISPLTSLTELTVLLLYNNDVIDISPLAFTPNLKKINLSNNKIQNISPLLDIKGLGKGCGIELLRNPINKNAKESCIPQLKQRGVKINPILGVSF